MATGEITGACKGRHRHQEFLAFLKQVARAYPDRELHLVMDNYAAHKCVEVRNWLAASPRIRVHFTPNASSGKPQVDWDDAAARAPLIDRRGARRAQRVAG